MPTATRLQAALELAGRGKATGQEAEGPSARRGAGPAGEIPDQLGRRKTGAGESPHRPGGKNCREGERPRNRENLPSVLY